MPLILAGTFDDMMVYFIVLFVVVVFLSPVVWWYIKTHGPLKEKDRAYLVIGTALLAGVITFPILLYRKSNERDPMTEQVANIAAGMEKEKQRQKQAQEQLARSLTVNEHGQLVTVRPQRQLTPAELEAKRKRDTERDAERKREQEAWHEARRVEREEREEANRKATEARLAKRKRDKDIFAAMQKAKSYKPPFETSTTSKQRELDEQIISANAVYVEVQTEYDRIEAIKKAAREEFSAAIRAKPSDRERKDAATKAFRESMQLKEPTSSDVWRERNKVETLVRERIKAEDEKE